MYFIHYFLLFQGCLGPLEDWYQQQYLILMLGLFIVAVFKLGVLMSTVFSCIRLRRRRQILQAFSMRSLDNNANENIYECKLSPVHEEPITAKYIQPNSFYSPRIRNPRIFHNKPNEVVWELATEINALERKLERFSDYLYKHQADSIMWWSDYQLNTGLVFPLALFRNDRFLLMSPSKTTKYEMCAINLILSEIFTIL